MTGMVHTLSVFYTHQLRGDLAILPRIVTALRGLRAEFAADRAVYLDIGAACETEVWHCDATEGRSMVLALDGIGCDAVNTSGYLNEAGWARLRAMHDSLRVALHEDAGLYSVPGLDDPPLSINMGSARTTQVFERVLYLRGLEEGGTIGVAHCVTAGDAWQVESSGVYAVPPSTPTDSTTTALIEFIRAEAESAGRRKRG